jgi:D-alanyl-D-alanine endopeptidase (penicillin-binding protein 7)
MTAMIVLDSKNNPLDEILISNSDILSNKIVNSNLKPGMQLQREDLLLLALMASENRAATALSRTNEPENNQNIFIQRMNLKAKSLQMNDTAFNDVSGLNPTTTSTAFDVAKLAMAAVDYDTIDNYTTTDKILIQINQQQTLTYQNNDKFFINEKSNIKLYKTGFIKESGRCIVVILNQNNQMYLIVLLNSKSNEALLQDELQIKNIIKSLKNN